MALYEGERVNSTLVSSSMKQVQMYSFYSFLVIEPASGGDHEENTQDGRGREGTSALLHVSISFILRLQFVFI